MTSGCYARRVGVCLAVGLLAVPMGAATAATANRGSGVITCGQTITKSTTLTADVGPCQADGIVIGANNVTLKLNGHHIFGNAALQDGPGNRAGIRLPNHSGVRILGDAKRLSTVSDFDGGIAIIRGSGNVITNVTARDNIGPRQVFEPDFGDGIVLISSKNNAITHNTVQHNGTFDGIGLDGVTSGNVIDSNDVVNNNIFKPEFFDKGIVLGPGASRNLVNNNTVIGSGPFGILVGQQVVPSLPPDFIPDPRVATPSPGNVVTNNRVMHNGFLGSPEQAGPSLGIAISNGAVRSVVSGNMVTDNGVLGIATVAEAGTFVNNNTRGNLGADLVDGSADAFAGFVDLPPCDHNVYRGNLFDEAFPGCIYVQQGLVTPASISSPTVAASKALMEGGNRFAFPQVPERRAPSL